MVVPRRGLKKIGRKKERRPVRITVDPRLEESLMRMKRKIERKLAKDNARKTVYITEVSQAAAAILDGRLKDMKVNVLYRKKKPPKLLYL